jgi:hypothetical protein
METAYRRSHKRRCEFPIAASLARGMPFCTEPGPRKFLSAIGMEEETGAGAARIAGIREVEVCRQSGEMAGAQWERCLRSAGRTGP